MDEEGYLYLTDRRAFMIVSGGVNIYPQEIEDVLLAHPRVLDVAVFGVPDDEMGEEVKAVVQPVRTDDAGESLAADLRAWCQDRLAGYKRPRSIRLRRAAPAPGQRQALQVGPARPLLGGPADQGGVRTVPWT